MAGGGQHLDLTRENGIRSDKTYDPYGKCGIMLYGSVDFMGIPLETAIKLFRDILGEEEKDTIRNYSDEFVQFLCDNEFCNDTQQKINVREILTSIFGEVRQIFHVELLDISNKKGRLGSRDNSRALTSAVNKKIVELDRLDDLHPFSAKINKNRIVSQYEGEYKTARNRVFSDHQLSHTLERKFMRLAKLSIIKDYFRKDQTESL